MICIAFEFPAGRYHATPWGHHVNEGLVEWPPSPWRILRALLATGYTKLGWQTVPNEMREVVDALAATVPTYRLPPAALGHTRHYMPIRGWQHGVQAKSLVIDAFVRPAGALGISWATDVSPEGRRLLQQVLGRLGYLGRAESRVKARVVSGDDLPSGWDISPERRAADDEPVRLLVPVSSEEYESWRDKVPAAPEDLLAALEVDTETLEQGTWNAPPGSREMIYWRPADAVSSQPVTLPRTSGSLVRADTALFALATDRTRDLLPLLERALPTMTLFRRAILSKLGESLCSCPELTGKDHEGRPLRHEHRHAHFIPLSLEPRNRGRIDHVLVHAPMGFGPCAQQALRRLSKTWAKDIGEIAVTLVGIGGVDSFRMVAGVPVPELGWSVSWESRTPFIPPRFLKPRGTDCLEGQLQRELRLRGLPALVAPPVVTPPGNADEASTEARRFRRFARTRKDGKGPGPPPGLFHVTLTFESPVAGPLCLGWGCHFGLGVFCQRA